MQEIESSTICIKCTEPVFGDATYCSACGTDQRPSGMRERVVVLRDFAAGALENADLAARDLLANDTIKKIAGGAVLGLGVATVIPFLTFTAGATLGAAFVGYKALTKN